MTAANINFGRGGNFNNVVEQTASSIYIDDKFNDSLIVGALKSSLVGATQTAGVCIFGGTCSNDTLILPRAEDSKPLFLISGSLTLEGSPAPVPVPVSATPEPSSLILLGTGALGLAGAARRRFFPRA